MTTPKADCEALMNSVLPLAEHMLATQGSFLPYGGAMRDDGEVVTVGGDDGNARPQPTETIALMKSAFVAAARTGDYKATAIVYDVKVKLPSTGERSDAIAVSLDHRDSYSVVVLFPYRIDSGRLTVGEAFAQAGDADIFPTQQPSSGEQRPAAAAGVTGALSKILAVLLNKAGS
jgi:hypothetical protein